MDSVPAARVGAVELAPALATGRFSGLWNREGFCAARRVPRHRRPARAVLRPREANWYTMWGALYATRRQGARGDEDRPSSHASENAANDADPPATISVLARYGDPLPGSALAQLLDRLDQPVRTVVPVGLHRPDRRIGIPGCDSRHDLLVL